MHVAAGAMFDIRLHLSVKPKERRPRKRRYSMSILSNPDRVNESQPNRDPFTGGSSAHIPTERALEQLEASWLAGLLEPSLVPQAARLRRFRGHVWGSPAGSLARRSTRRSMPTTGSTSGADVSQRALLPLGRYLRRLRRRIPRRVYMHHKHHPEQRRDAAQSQLHVEWEHTKGASCLQWEEARPVLSAVGANGACSDPALRETTTNRERE